MILCDVLQLGACVCVCFWFKLICTDEKIKIYYLHSISGGMLGICSVLMLHNTTYLFIYLVKNNTWKVFRKSCFLCIIPGFLFSFLPPFFAILLCRANLIKSV